MSGDLVRPTDIARQEIQFPTLRRKCLAFKTHTTIDGFLAGFELRQRELSAFRFLVLNIQYLKLHAFRILE